MPTWINARNRIPEKYGQYFVRVNSRPDIYTYHEFAGRLEKLYNDDELMWLDESTAVAVAPVVPIESAPKPHYVRQKVIDVWEKRDKRDKRDKMNKMLRNY